jgi:plastocyanin
MRAPHLAAVLLVALAAPDARSTTAGGVVTGVVRVRDGSGPAKRDEVWVYLELQHRPRHAQRATPTSREIRQQKREFVPHVLVVPVGATVAFPNYDREEHNVFSPTDPPGIFDLGRYNTDHKGHVHEFEDAGEIAIFCDIHPQMWARVKVVDTDPAWIAKVGPDGRYAIAGVPPGTYTVKAWTYASDESSETVAVTESATVEVPELHVVLGTLQAHLRKDGTPYPPYPK